MKFVALKYVLDLISQLELNLLKSKLGTSRICLFSVNHKRPDADRSAFPNV